MPLKEPLAPATAQQLIRRILRTGNVSFSDHALEELAKDKLTTVDVVNVLRGGTVRPGDFERGTWRYRVETARITAVVAFRSEDDLRLVTVWRRG